MAILNVPPFYHLAMVVLQYGEMIGDLLSLCDKEAKDRPKLGLSGLKVKAIVEPITI